VSRRPSLADDPDVLCVQEVPSWALGRFTVGDLAARPTVGPFPSSARLGRRLTSLHHGVLRSAFSGQGNAIAVAPRLRVLAHELLELNPRRFRIEEGRRLGLGVVARNAWAKERRVVQTVRLGADDMKREIRTMWGPGSRDDREAPVGWETRRSVRPGR